MSYKASDSCYSIYCLSAFIYVLFLVRSRLSIFWLVVGFFINLEFVLLREDWLPESFISLVLFWFVLDLF